MEQSTDVNRFRCKPIGRQKRTRAGRVPACVAINDPVLDINADAVLLLLLLVVVVVVVVVSCKKLT